MNELELIKKVIISGVLSGIIGLEREKHGREAGLRTMILVGMGTTTILITSFQVYYIFANVQNNILRIDPARIAYGVVTGIGFLGAGVIIKDRKRIRGLTTAACLWFVTSIGLAVGVGLYFLSYFLTFISLLILYFLKLFEKNIPTDTYSVITIIGEEEKVSKDDIEKMIINNKFKILGTEIEKRIKKKEIKLVFNIRYSSKQKVEKFLEEISKIEGLIFIKVE
ncbi:MAG: MgtC/SapB family protein [bacterium]|nr:MgtC/SapB family protein [bacterium]